MLKEELSVALSAATLAFVAVFIKDFGGLFARFETNISDAPKAVKESIQLYTEALELDPGNGAIALNLVHTLVCYSNPHFEKRFSQLYVGNRVGVPRRL